MKDNWMNEWEITFNECQTIDELIGVYFEFKETIKTWKDLFVLYQKHRRRLEPNVSTYVDRYFYHLKQTK